MKITTLEYDANQPITKQITVPLNSDYAAGVKVYRNGEAVSFSENELSVDGQTPTEVVAGYSVFNLSSDSAEGLKELDVAISKGPSVNVTVEQTLTGQSTVPFPFNVNLDLQLSGYVSGQINKMWIGLPTATATNGATTGDFWDFPEANSIYVYPQGLGTMKPLGFMNRDKHDNIYWNDQLSGDTIDFNENAVLRYQWNFASPGTVSVDAEFVIKSDDAFTTNFKLNVQQKDLGYFEKFRPSENARCYAEQEVA